MEQNHDQNHNSHGMRKYMHGNPILRLILALVVLVIVFKIGVMVGEFKSHFRHFRHNDRQSMMQPRMMGNSVYFDKNLEGAQMMPQGVTTFSTQAIPSAPAIPESVK